MDQYLYVLRNAFRASGRDTRKQFWMFTLFYIIFTIVAVLIDAFVFGVDVTSETQSTTGPAQWLVLLVHIVPSITTGVRRLHDRDWRGWWVLIALVPLIGAIILIVLYCLKGTAGPNRFGEDPYGANPNTFA
ncbi:MAG: DUF805 domain-containing protein [Pseudomonadota bacterium]